MQTDEPISWLALRDLANKWRKEIAELKIEQKKIERPTKSSPFKAIPEFDAKITTKESCLRELVVVVGGYPEI